MNAVDQFVVAGELAGAFTRGVNHAAQHIVELGHARKTRHFHIAKAMEGESRFINLRPLPLPFHHINVRGQGAFVAFHINVAVGQKIFRVAQGDTLAPQPRCGEPHPARKVLPQIEHVNTRLGIRHRDRLEVFDDFDGRHEMRDEHATRRFDDIGRLPTGVGRAGQIPAWQFLGRVILLPIKDAGRKHRPGCRFPRAIRPHHL